MRIQIRHRRIIAVVMALMLASSSSVALATAYSAWGYKGVFNTGPTGNADMCLRAGMIDVARNHGHIRSWTTVPQGCTGNAKVLNSGYLGVTLDGYRSGAFCGTTGFIYSNVATSGWIVEANLCSNPSGLQGFNTTTWGRVFNGNNYVQIGGMNSPIQNY